MWYGSRVAAAADFSLGQPEPGADELISALGRGELDALRTVYQRHHEAVRAFAGRLIGDEADAEELVQEVFVTLPCAIRRFRSDASLRTFLISITANHARHYVRAAMRRRAALQRLAIEPPHASVSLPDEPLERAELADALTRALDRIPIDQRVAFVLCEVEERSSQEAAFIVGVPDSTLRARLRAAKRRLRELLNTGELS